MMICFDDGNMTRCWSLQGGQWEPYWQALEQPVRDKLSIMYGL